MKMQKMQKKNNKGFSLVELIVVIAIMAVLVGVLAPTLVRNVEKSREAKDLQALDSIRGVVTAMVAEEKYYDAMVEKKFTIANKGNVMAAADGSTVAEDALTTINNEFKENIDKVELTSVIGKAAANTIVVNVGANGSVTVYLVKTATPNEYLAGKSADFITGTIPTGVVKEGTTPTTPAT